MMGACVLIWASLLAILVIGSTNYTVRDVIDDDTGMTTLMLEAA